MPHAPAAASCQPAVHLAPLSLPAAVDILAAADLSAPHIFLVPDGQWDECRAVISQARAASLTNVVLLARTSLSPLGRAALAQICQSVTSRLTASQMIALIGELEQTIRCLAVTESVTRLRRPTPSMWQHITSWLPRSRFLVSHDLGVLTLRSGEALPVTELPPVPGPAVLVRGRGAGAEADAVCAELAAGLGQPPLLSIDADPGDWWGRREVIDLCIAPADLTPFLIRAAADSVDCSWCRMPSPADGCRVCQPQSLTGEAA